MFFSWLPNSVLWQVYMDVGVVAHATGSAYVEFNHTKVRSWLFQARTFPHTAHIRLSTHVHSLLSLSQMYMASTTAIETTRALVPIHCYVRT